MSLKNHLKEQIAKNQFSEVFVQLKQQLGPTGADLNTVINLQGQFHSMEREQMQGLVSKEEASLTINRIRNALLSIIDELPEQPLPVEQDDLAELEASGWNTEAQLIVKKINRIREALVLEDDPARQFKYEQQVEKLENQLRALKDRLKQ